MWTSFTGMNSQTSSRSKLGDNNIQFKTRVVGVTYDNRQHNINQITQNTKIILRREPDNPYDKHAIRVLTKSGLELGYINRQLADLLVQEYQFPLSAYPARINQIIGKGGIYGNTGIEIIFNIDKQTKESNNMDINLSIPKTLYDSLRRMAQKEGVSTKEYILYLLSQIISHQRINNKTPIRNHKKNYGEMKVEAAKVDDFEEDLTEMTVDGEELSGKSKKVLDEYDLAQSDLVVMTINGEELDIRSLNPGTVLRFENDSGLNMTSITWAPSAPYALARAKEAVKRGWAAEIVYRA